jgi:AcrR family transcriptional regulator
MTAFARQSIRKPPARIPRTKAPTVTKNKKVVAKKAKAATNLAMREDSINRLSEAAFQLFVSQGYHATSLDEIAQAAGLTKGAIFFYFASKEKLLLQLLDIAERAVVDPLLERLKDIEGSATDKVAGFFRFSSRHGGIEQPQKLLCLIKTSIEFRDRRNVIGARIRTIYSRIYRELESVISAGKERGEIGDIPARELTSMIVATNDGMMLEWHRRGSQIDGPLFVRTVWMTFLDGIVVKRK